MNRRITSFLNDFAPAISGAIITVIPIIQFGFVYNYLWVPGRPAVNRSTCENSCFDTIFKGSYELPHVKHGYKHVYFNVNWNTSKIWMVTVLYVLLGYEALKYLLHLLTSGSLRFSMLLLSSFNVYPHVYAWWAFFTYYNEDYYPFFSRQVYFAITEALVTGVLLKLCNAESSQSLLLYGIAVGTSSVHAIVGGIDQFFVQLLFERKRTFRVWRNLGLMSPDLVTAIVCTVDYLVMQRRQRLTSNERCSGNDTKQRFTTKQTFFLIAFYVVAIFIVGLFI